MAPNAFRILLVLVVLYALVRGKRDERLVSIILAVGVIATTLALSPLRQRYTGLETNVMLIDVAVFAGFLWVALRSKRFWPLWIAGLQLTTLFGHVFKLIDPRLFSWAYGAALAFWGYPIVLILAVGTWRAQRRAERREQLGSPT